MLHEPVDAMLQPHQAQASLSTERGGLGLTSAEARRMSAPIGSLVATVPEVLADLSGTHAAGESPEGAAQLGLRPPHLKVASAACVTCMGTG